MRPMKLHEYFPFYRRNLLLAAPVVMSQIGQVTVSLIDNMMVGYVGTTELAAASFANNVFMIGMIFGMGITFGLTPLTGETYGKGKLKQTAQWLKNGIVTHLLAAVGLSLLMLSVYWLLPFLGQTDDVVKLAQPYYLWLCASLLPFMIFFTFKQFWEGIGNTHIAMIITLTANVVNVVVNYLFIFGKFGFPELGLTGAGIGTFVARFTMPFLFWIVIRRNCRYRRYLILAHHQLLRLTDIVKILRLGIPIAFQLIVEVSAFSLGAVMMGWLGEVDLAAHQVAIGMASLTYMISVGISSATTIRVSHQKGVHDYLSMKRAAYASTHLVLFFMSMMGITFVLLRNQLPLLFTSDPQVIAIAAQLLVVAAFFQVFDGLQVVMLGSLRGMSDVRIPMLIAFLAYLALGLPASYFFAFVLKLGPEGIWYGYLLGLGTAGILFYGRFRRNLKQLL